MPRNIDEYDDAFAESRADAQMYSEKSNKHFRLSQEAHRKGDLQTSKMHSNEGKRFKRLKVAADKLAAEAIFGHHNRDCPSNVIDLHGLYVSEAIERLKQRVAQCREENSLNLIVIVGKGKHSSGGPKIKPAVVSYAMKSRLHFHPDSPNAGCITIEFVTGSTRHHNNHTTIHGLPEGEEPDASQNISRKAGKSYGLLILAAIIIAIIILCANGNK